MKSSASSRRERRRYVSVGPMKKVPKKVIEDLKRLAAMPDSEIDFSDIPEVTDFSGAVVGKFYRPIKKPLTVRLDADVLAWLKRGGRGYQTRMNRVLRNAMVESMRRRKAS